MYFLAVVMFSRELLTRLIWGLHFILPCQLAQGMTEKLGGGGGGGWWA